MHFQLTIEWEWGAQFESAKSVSDCTDMSGATFGLSWAILFCTLNLADHLPGTHLTSTCSCFSWCAASSLCALQCSLAIRWDTLLGTVALGCRCCLLLLCLKLVEEGRTLLSPLSIFILFCAICCCLSQYTETVCDGDIIHQCLLNECTFFCCHYLIVHLHLFPVAN